jgi:hypothetical protein
MRLISAVLFAGAMVVSLTVISPKARANIWNEKTIVTFNQPVEIPGHVLLPGTYTFSLMNSDADRDIVEVKSDSHPQFTYIVLTNPAERLQSSPNSTFEFEKLHPNSPEAIKEWFYPGALYGQQFAYGSQASERVPACAPLGK